MSRAGRHISNIPFRLVTSQDEMDLPPGPTNKIIVRDPALVPWDTICGYILYVWAIRKSGGGDA